jgi:hypothetical protein
MVRRERQQLHQALDVAVRRRPGTVWNGQAGTRSTNDRLNLPGAEPMGVIPIW